MDLSLIIASVLGGGTGIFSAFKAYSNVEEGHKSVRTTWGKAVRDKKTGLPKIYEPGGKWMWPFAQKMNNLRMSGNIVTLENLSITLKNNLTYNFDAFITYDVKDDPQSIFNILFILENRDVFVENQFKKMIQKVLHRSEELDVKAASSRIKKEMSLVLDESGWIVTDCDIMLFTETSVSQFLRGVDYRIQKAIEFKDQLPNNLLCSALGVNAVVNVQDDFSIEEQTPEE